MYIHMYFNSEKAVEYEKNLNTLLCTLHEELESGRRNPEHEKQYAKYFDIKTTSVRVTKVTAKQEAIVVIFWTSEVFEEDRSHPLAIFIG